MHQPFSCHRALYGAAPRWFVPLLFGTVLGMGLLQRLGRRRVAFAV